MPDTRRLSACPSSDGEITAETLASSVHHVYNISNEILISVQTLMSFSFSFCLNWVFKHIRGKPERVHQPTWWEENKNLLLLCSCSIRFKQVKVRDEFSILIICCFQWTMMQWIMSSLLKRPQPILTICKSRPISYIHYCPDFISNSWLNRWINTNRSIEEVKMIRFSFKFLDFALFSEVLPDDQNVSQQNLASSVNSG